MARILKCMFDTNVFNRIVDEEIALEPLTDRVTAYATHVQRDGINNTTDPERRAVLAKVFRGFISQVTNTTSVAAGDLTCIFLASSESDFITGQTLVVDGGSAMV